MPTISHAMQARLDAQDALLARMGVPLARFDQHDRPLTDAHGRALLRTPSRQAVALASAPLHELIEVYLRSCGSAELRCDLSSMGRPRLIALAMNRSKLRRYFPHLPPRGIALAHSTGDFPGLLADTLGKATATLYAEARRSWRAWAKQALLDDFKQQDRVRLDDFNNLPVKLPGDEITFDQITEKGREQYTLATYAKGVSVTREAVLNDDVGLLGSIPAAFVQAAARVEDALSYRILETNAAMSDGVALFHDDHGNLTTGALTAATYGAARAKLARQTTPGGDVVDLVGARLIVPPELSGTAESVLADSAKAQRALGESPALLVESPFLANATQWYLAADPRFQPAVEVAFLRSEPEPVVSEDVGFDNDTIKIKCRHSVAAAAVDHRPIVRSSGS